MNREKLLSALTGTGLGLALSAGSIGCLQSAFGLTVQRPELLWGTVCLFCCLYALCLPWKRGPLVFACGLALCAGYLLRYGTAWEETRALVQHLSSVYDRAYHWGFLEFPGVASDGPMDLPLGIWATITALSAVRTTTLSKSCVPPVLLALFPLCLCTVVTDTIPGEAPVFLLLAGLILLILPASVRRENRLQSIRLTAAALLPVLFALTLLFRAVPQDTYVSKTAVIQENIRTALEHFPQLMEDGLEEVVASLRGKPAQTVDLSRLGDRIPFTYPVMEVTAETSGPLYLRGQDYDQYDGTGWTATKSREESFFRQDGTIRSLAIRTQGFQQVQYLPYYPAEPVVLTGGCTGKPEWEIIYTYSVVSLPEDWRKQVYTSAETAPEADLQPYTGLPMATRQAAAEWLAQIDRPGASNTEIADSIAALVTDCASYSLSPVKMPEGTSDFALWFLKEADTGYCIHFATAATVLLRAADVPARYVTGYMVETTAGKTVTVTEAEAHAWAEYYEPRLGCWIPLEATPAGNPEELTPATLPEPTETAASTASTAATEATAPETTPSPAPVPQIPAEPDTPSEKSHSAWLLLLLIPAAMGILAVLRSIRLHLRRKRQRTGSPNAQALHRFREAERLARLLKETPAEELIDLAQKAKYSQHEITPEELQHFDSYCRSCLRRLKEKPLHRQLIYRYLYAVY